MLGLAGAVVVALVVGVVWSASQHARAGHSAPPTPPSGSAPEVRLASRLVDALAFFDVVRARDLFAPGATFTGATSTNGWVGTMRFFHETGQILPGRCRAVAGSGAATVVDCPYRYQLMRSGDLGLGPYAGSSFQITVSGGQVTRVFMDHEVDTNGFATQMWTPFAAWIDAFHRGDGAAMYPGWPQQHHWPDTDRAIQLWSQRTWQFVRYADHLCHTPADRDAAVCSGRRSPAG